MATIRSHNQEHDVQDYRVEDVPTIFLVCCKTLQLIGLMMSIDLCNQVRKMQE